MLHIIIQLNIIVDYRTTTHDLILIYICIGLLILYGVARDGLNNGNRFIQSY